MIIDQLSACMEITALEIIREKMGGTYSPSVNVSYSRIPEQEVDWTFYINCNPDSTSLIENAALEILKKYINEGPDAETLAKVQEQQIINRQNSKQNNGFWMGQIMGSYRFNESRDDIDKYDQLVKSVSVKDIKKMAKKYLNLKNYVVVTLKPEAKENHRKTRGCAPPPPPPAPPRAPGGGGAPESFRYGNKRESGCLGSMWREIGPHLFYLLATKSL